MCRSSRAVRGPGGGRSEQRKTGPAVVASSTCLLTTAAVARWLCRRAASVMPAARTTSTLGWYQAIRQWLVGTRVNTGLAV